jgi:hypothetical protein
MSLDRADVLLADCGARKVHANLKISNPRRSRFTLEVFHRLAAPRVRVGPENLTPCQRNSTAPRASRQAKPAPRELAAFLSQALSRADAMSASRRSRLAAGHNFFVS